MIVDPLEITEPSKEDPIATIDEVREAIEGLSSAELNKLEKYSRYRIRGLGRRAAGRDHEDLLKEAITATLSGNRRWRKESVPFQNHLLGTIRSISSHWGEKTSTSEAYLESELVRDNGSDRPYSPFQDIASDVPEADRLLSARQQLDRIYKRFDNDPDIPSLLEGLSLGLSGPEIQAQFKFSKNKYEAALRRLRRGVSALEE